MRTYARVKGNAIPSGLGLFFVVAIFAIKFVVGAFLFPYTLNFWLHYLHKETLFTAWALAGLGTMLFPKGHYIVGIAAVATWIISFFL